MRDLVRAELLKLRTTRMFWGYIASALAFVPVSVAIALDAAGDEWHASLHTAEGVRQVMSAATAGGVMLLVIGILTITGEFRHNTATATFLVTPDRRRVVAAKLAAAGIIGVAVSLAAAVLTLGIAVPCLAARHAAVASHTRDIVLVLAASLAATTLSAVVGVGVGALIRNQTAAVTATLVWIFTAEGLLVSFAPVVGRWLPGGASSALTSTPTAHGGLLPMWGGALLFVGYGLALAAAGTRRIVRLDVT